MFKSIEEIFNATGGIGCFEDEKMLPFDMNKFKLELIHVARVAITGSLQNGMFGHPKTSWVGDDFINDAIFVQSLYSLTEQGTIPLLWILNNHINVPCRHLCGCYDF